MVCEGFRGGERKGTVEDGAVRLLEMGKLVEGSIMAANLIAG